MGPILLFLRSLNSSNFYWSLLHDNCVITNITQVQALSSLKKHRFNKKDQIQVFQIAFFNDFPGLLQIVGVLLVLISIVSFGFRGIVADRQKNVTNIWARDMWYAMWKLKSLGSDFFWTRIPICLVLFSLNLNKSCQHWYLTWNLGIRSDQFLVS